MSPKNVERFMLVVIWGSVATLFLCVFMACKSKNLSTDIDVTVQKKPVLEQAPPAPAEVK